MPLVLAPVLLLLASAVPVAADNDDPADPRRPQRLADALNGHEEWQIGIAEPAPARTGGFRDAVADGTALESAAYVEIHEQLQRELSAASAGTRGPGLSALRERIRQRVELNLDAGYFYAAGVYIELLDLSGADRAEIRRLTETLRERRG